MQLLDVFIMQDALAFFGASEDVQRSAIWIDNRSRCDSDFGRDKRTTQIPCRHCRDASIRVEETHLPQWRGFTAIGIERVYAVVFGRDEYYVMLSFPGDLHARHKERLCIDVAVHWKRKELSEPCRVHIPRGKDH